MIHKTSPGEDRGCSCGDKRDNNNDDDKKSHSTYGLHSTAKLKGVLLSEESKKLLKCLKLKVNVMN